MNFGIIFFIDAVVILALIGVWHTKNKKFSVEGYIGEHNSLSLWASISTIFASGMGAWILFGPAETSVLSGIGGLIGYALGGTFSLWIFIVFGLRLRRIMPRGFTLTEYVMNRFGKGMYVVVLFISVFYMFIALAAELTGIALAGQLVFEVPLIVTALVVGFGTLSYTALGGFRASVFTDKVQTWIIVPFLAVVFVFSSFLIGGLKIFDKVKEIAPEALMFSGTGFDFGLTLIIAVVGAELFNQGWWQRVYSAKSENIMKKSYFISGVFVFPVILIVGLFGIFALGTGTAEEPSIALFSFLLEVSPTWLIFVAMILAIALVMSSLDTLLNGVVSIFAINFAKNKSKVSEKSVLRVSRWIAAIVIAFAVLIAAFNFSVLYLFLLADLVCVAAVFPVFYGLYSKKISQNWSIYGIMMGILAGLFFFPVPDFSTSVFGLIFPSLGLGGSLLFSFIIALIVPAIVSLLFDRKGNFDFDSLKENELVLEG